MSPLFGSDAPECAVSGGPAGRAGFAVTCDGREVPVVFVRHRRARRYILRLAADGSARVTVPRGGTLEAACEFVRSHVGWLEQQLRQPPRAVETAPWRPGHVILFRGEEHPLTPVPVPEHCRPLVRLADQEVVLPGPEVDLRLHVQAHLWSLAAGELPPLTWDYARQHGLNAQRVTIRNQRSRWGSCSAAGNISLNWRLVMMPPWVRDYVILHELMHLREANHSDRFWRAVAAVCPDYQAARAWIRQNGQRLH